MEQDRIDKFPASLQSVATSIQGGIAQHGIQQQTLVSVRKIALREGIVAEVHADLLHLETGSRHFQPELQGYTLVRLDTDGQFIAGTSRTLTDKQLMGRRLEVDHYLR